jgi:hypothetical protein
MIGRNSKATAAVQHRERGATATIVALLLTALVGAAALAVDVGHWYDRANQLQVASDAASLGAVAVRVGGGSDAAIRAEVDKLLLDNGIDPADPGLEITVTNVGQDQVRVEVADKDVDVLFGKIFGTTMSINRGSTSQLDICRADCRQAVELPQPWLALKVAGTGDGFTPIIVPGSRMFAINHKSTPTSPAAISSSFAKSITCVDRNTNAICAGYPRALSSVAGDDGSSIGDLYTNNRPSTVVIGTRIYFVGQRVSDFGLACFDTLTNTSCGYVELANLPAATGTTFNTRGGGPALLGGKLYLFSDDLRWHCVDPASMSMCGGYPAPSGLADDSLPALASGPGGQTIPIDVEIADGRLYSAVHYNGQGGLGSMLTCFDPSVAKSCSGFGETGHRTRFNLTATGVHGGDGALFVRFDSAANANGICMLRARSLGMDCVDLDGRSHGAVAGLDAHLNPTSGATMDMYAEYHVGGRTYFPEGWVRHATLCWDWTTGGLCSPKGRMVWTSPEGPGTTGDYGYASNGRCIVGLGHDNRWWAFDEDLDLCKDTSIRLNLSKCLCVDGRTKWGTITISQTDLLTGAEFLSFKARLILPDGTVFYEQELVGTDGRIDLDKLNLPSDVDNVTLDIEATSVDGFVAWSDGLPPVVEFEYREVPSLVD